jgi:hypothetical protein
MTYLPNGKIDDGPLSTDRPHTVKLHGFYSLKWLHQETLLGFTQAIFQGTPISSCLPVVGTGSACQWAEGRGNFTNFTRAANGDFVNNGVTIGRRTDPYLQTDVVLRQEFRVHEGYRLALEANVFNILNQHSGVAYNEGTFGGSRQVINPTRAPRFSGDPKTDWNRLMSGYDYTALINAQRLTLASRYGLPQVFQSARSIRLSVRFIF